MHKYLILGVVTFLVGAIVLYFYATKQWDSSKTIATKVSEVQNDFVSAVSPKYISPISIEYLRGLNIEGSDINIEETLSNGSGYKRFVASYRSDGYKIYGLLTVPTTEKPEGGFPAIVFNHGYIPPQDYSTQTRYVAYVDYLARNGFVVFKIDFRGHGNSEGYASGSYFSNAYTIDAINAVKSLQKFKDVNPDSIGMWGHSMSGNVTLRSMLVSPDIKAGVIWGGAVYSYKDFKEYGISDNSYSRNPRPTAPPSQDTSREQSTEVQKIRDPNQQVDFESDFWKSISLTDNLKYLNTPIQLDHALNDNVVSVKYSQDLEKSLKEAGKSVELYTYQGGGHNIDSPYFEEAMKNTVRFFKDNLNK